MAFESFTSQIPQSVLTQVKISECDELAVYRPKTYLVNTKLYAKDYHFVLPSSCPPPTWIENKKYIFGKGKLLAINPETVLLTTEKVPTKEYIDFTIKKEFLEQVAWEAAGKSHVCFERKDNVCSRGLIGLIESFEEETACFKDACPIMTRSIATQIVIRLLREAGSNVHLNECGAVPDKRYMERALQYIEAYYNSNITIDDICSSVHVSSYHFIRMFKTHTGKTPHQYLIELRLTKAEDMLLRGEYKIEEVAELCGFLSKSHFAAQFKRIKGTSPSDYRRGTLRQL